MMKRKTSHGITCAVVWMLLGAAGVAAAADAVLKPGARLAIVGDSITEQRLYSKYIETYLLACRPELDVRVLQLGISGEIALGFLERMDYDLLPWKPDVVTLCYGMNDGGYQTYTNLIGEEYLGAMSNIVARIKAAGAVPVIGGPGVVDNRYYVYARRGPAYAAALYNENLARLRDLGRQLAADEQVPFADVHGVMKTAMTAAKAALGDDYAVAGGMDGIHPGPNGHLLMAYAFLKALGMDGHIGTITLTWGDRAEVTPGHKIVTATGGVIVVESSRYPFCTPTASTNASEMAGILPFVPFEQELNRLMLVVQGLPTAKARVIWGDARKEFTRPQLESGINLAAEFLDNPFSMSFERVMDAVERKQVFETDMIKFQFVRQRQRAIENPAQVPALRQERDALLSEQANRMEEARRQVTPLCHVIVIEPLDGP